MKISDKIVSKYIVGENKGELLFTLIRYGYALSLKIIKKIIHKLNIYSYCNSQEYTNEYLYGLNKHIPFTMYSDVLELLLVKYNFETFTTYRKLLIKKMNIDHSKMAKYIDMGINSKLLMDLIDACSTFKGYNIRHILDTRYKYKIIRAILDKGCVLTIDDLQLMKTKYMYKFDVNQIREFAKYVARYIKIENNILKKVINIHPHYSIVSKLSKCKVTLEILIMVVQHKFFGYGIFPDSFALLLNRGFTQISVKDKKILADVILKKFIPKHKYRQFSMNKAEFKFVHFLTVQGFNNRLNSYDTNKYTLLKYAIKKEFPTEQIVDLVKCGANMCLDKNGHDQIQNAIRYGNWKILEYFGKEGFFDRYKLSGRKNLNLLHYASLKNRYKCIRILSNYYDVNQKTAKGLSPIIFSGIHNSLDAIRVLIDCGANYNVKYKNMNIFDILCRRIGITNMVHTISSPLLQNCYKYIYIAFIIKYVTENDIKSLNKDIRPLCLRICSIKD